MKRVAALAVVVLLLLPVVCQAGVRVIVLSEVIVTGPQLTLGDIAQIDGDDAARITNLKKIPLGGAPVPGTKTVLSREVLTTRLIASQTDLSGIAWEPVPEAIAIAAGGQVVDGMLLAETAMAKLRNSLPIRQNEEIVISLLQDVPDVVVPLGVITYDLAPQSVRFGTPQTIYLQTVADGVLFRKIPIKCEIKRFATVVTMTEPITTRTMLTPELVRLSWMEVSRLPAGYLTDTSKAVGLVVLRSMPAGSVLYSSHLDRPVLVKRGAVIVILAISDNVVVTAPGVALSDGREGQQISVRNTATKRMVAARVLDKETVEVYTR